MAVYITQEEVQLHSWRDRAEQSQKSDGKCWMGGVIPGQSLALFPPGFGTQAHLEKHVCRAPGTSLASLSVQ